MKARIRIKYGELNEQKYIEFVNIMLKVIKMPLK